MYILSLPHMNMICCTFYIVMMMWISIGVTQAMEIGMMNIFCKMMGMC